MSETPADPAGPTAPAEPMPAAPVGPAEPAPPSVAQPVPLSARDRDKRLGMLIVLGAFIIGIGISAWAKHASRPETSEPPGPPVTTGVVGFPDRVDVVKTLPAARALTKRTLLRGFVADGVRSDGTVDVSEGPGRARYAFQSPPGQGPLPPMEPGTPPRQKYCGRQDVHLRHEGIVLEKDKPEILCTARHGADSLPDPQCTLADVWRHALTRGFPGDRLARIEYYRSRSGPAWRFELPDDGRKFSLYGDCRSELAAHDAAGRVP